MLETEAPVLKEKREEALIRTKTALQEHSSLYATASDFCRIFREDMNNLYRLSLLLTADSEMAEQSFVSGLDECSQTNRVFQDWAASWARRVIIQNAIRLLTPTPANTDSHHADLNAIRNKPGYRPAPQPRPEISAVLGLETFDRFVFVMTVLERYSDQDCALMLGSTRQEVIAARVHAMQQITRSETRDGGSKASALPREKPMAFAIAAPLATPA